MEFKVGQESNFVIPQIIFPAPVPLDTLNLVDFTDLCSGKYRSLDYQRIVLNPAGSSLTAGPVFRMLHGATGPPQIKVHLALKTARQAFVPVHRFLRKRKVRLFFEALNPRPSDTMLDIGGWLGEDGEFTPLYNFFENITSLNLIDCEHGHAQFVRGDACRMPFESKSYDYVFSNAVIEHVGDFARQRMMAAEVIRVARKGYFVSTPNRWFPIDPHSYLPFLHLMPLKVRRAINPSCDYWMLSGRYMQRLFPNAEIVITPDRTSVIALGIM